jgi:hypothetical protein
VNPGRYFKKGISFPPFLETIVYVGRAFEIVPTLKNPSTKTTLANGSYPLPFCLTYYEEQGKRSEDEARGL